MRTGNNGEEDEEEVKVERRDDFDGVAPQFSTYVRTRILVECITDPYLT